MYDFTWLRRDIFVKLDYFYIPTLNAGTTLTLFRANGNTKSFIEGLIIFSNGIQNTLPQSCIKNVGSISLPDVNLFANYLREHKRG